MIDSKTKRLIILGGGPAGLAAAWYGFRNGLDITLLEAAPVTGGNARTLEFESFRLDTGAHRFHARDPEITRDLSTLLGDDLTLIDVPSAIREGNRFVSFPLDPVNLLSQLGPGAIGRATFDLVRARLRGRPAEDDFRSISIHRYGATIAERYLLGYTEKLWGVSPSELSSEVSGRRLRGIDLRTFLGIAGKNRSDRTRHLDGSFLYPRLGIGMITDALAEALPAGTIRLSEPVEEIVHEGERVLSIRTSRDEYHTDRETEVVSTLPIDRMIRILSPTPGPGILDAVTNLGFRTLRIALLGVARDRLTKYASLYFPDRDVPFTRLYESKNRSEAMAPPGRTGVAIELPTGPGEEWYTADPGDVLERARTLLEREFGLSKNEFVLSRELRLENAYPVLTRQSRLALEGVLPWLSVFTNLTLSGRNQRFRYLHIHDLLREARDMVIGSRDIGEGD